MAGGARGRSRQAGRPGPRCSSPPSTSAPAAPRRLRAAGRLLGRAEAPLDIHETPEGHVEQSSLQIWRAAGAALRAARAEAAAEPSHVAGLGFDATCSLVLRDAAGRPVTASTTGDHRRDTILWLDHRAAAETDAINAAGPHPVLDHAGGALSPEMQLPKLLWLRRHLPESWSRLANAFDLTDFLTFAATGNPARCAMHPRLQVGLPRPPRPRAGARTSSTASALPTSSSAPASPPPRPRSPPTSAR